MPHYYIDTDDGTNAVLDRDGYDYPNNREARRAAISHLPDMAGDVLPDGNRRKLTVLLRDATRQPIFRATLSLEAEWLVPNEPGRD